MKIKKLLSSGLIALAIAATTDFASAGSATPESIIVMPARKRVVQLAFQMSRCKDIGLVTYNNSPALSAPLIHVWTGQEWVQISLDDYVQGRFMSGEPKHVFGTQNTPFTQALNQIGTALKFSSRQWKWIAEENGLKINDENAERRRYGRWGAPGQEKDLKPTKLENVELPPVAPIAEPTKADLEKAEKLKDSCLPEAAPEAKPTTKAEAAPEAKPTLAPPAPVVEKPAPVEETPVKQAVDAPAPAARAKAIDPTSK